MERVRKFFYRRRLNKTREEAQLMWDYANVKRKNQGWDKYRPIDDFFTTRENRVWDEILADEWLLSELLSVKPEWGDSKRLSSALGEDSPVGFMTVTEDRSTKLGYEYVPEVDMMATTHNGKWSSNKVHWHDVEMFKKQGWGRPPEFNEYLKRWNDAKTEEETEAVLQEYRDRFPNAVY